MTSSTDDNDEHSTLWQDCRDEVESYGVDWGDHRQDSLKNLGLNVLRKAAAALDIPVHESKDELAQALTDEDCFLGPIGDDTIYQERDGDAVPIVGRRGALGMTSWRRLGNADED